MKLAQLVLDGQQDLIPQLGEIASLSADLVLVFGSVLHMQDAAMLGAVIQATPGAIRIGCSTAGEIADRKVADDSCVVTAVKFDSTKVALASTHLHDMNDSAAAGERLARGLPSKGLKAVIVIGQGVNINGSALVRGIELAVGGDIPISGGLAGDGGAFAKTWVLVGDHVADDEIVAVGLYGEHLEFSAGSFGGWQTFGPARRVTRCDGNVLYELDNEPALNVYQRYLGGYASGLPASGLLFPFAMVSDKDSSNELIRTILAVDREAGSLTLAGEIQLHGSLKLMHATTDRLVDGAATAAERAQPGSKGMAPGLALLVSCVGRKLVMGDRVDEEVEAVSAAFPEGAVISGFYSYGEISPMDAGACCGLHNQTMTIAYITES